jgi:BirA family transcriptional regulator, biotin operon repressor / biotin---[acetyl-CoA-carboxylase] ligase
MTRATPRPQRTPLSAESVRAAILPGSRLYTAVDVVPRTGSTNADLLAAARAGAAAGAVLVAEEQTAGRGRLDRSWQSQPGAALTFSVLLRPADVPAASRGWLPLLTGVAVATALPAVTGVDVSLKWPNDVLAGPATPVSGGKLGGILAEQAVGAIVVGIGLNVSAAADELPAAQATSLWLAGAAAADRAAILVRILRELEHWYLRWANGPQPGNAESSGLHAAYVRACSTLGRDVRVELPGGDILTGLASGVDAVGRLLVTAADGVQAVSAGDVVHVRPQL